MALSVEIDPGSGFCAGVIRAIGAAENFLDTRKDGTLYSLGAIVHNEEEMARLQKRGLDHIELSDLYKQQNSHKGETLLIRAHGEPPSTYKLAASLEYEVIDCTCPVVLRLQAEIKRACERVKPFGGTIIIFGKVGHAEVLGLLGQVDGNAVVVENLEMLQCAQNEGRIPLEKPIELFSQTTKSPEEYSYLAQYLKGRISCQQKLTVHETICKQVATRHKLLKEFARNHSAVVFVAGESSSNGRVLFSLCRSVNPRSYRVVSELDLDPSWFVSGDNVGVCGATSTPGWLLEKVASGIENFAL